MSLCTRSIWLLGTLVLIWLMIMLGGATRLTHSGLSIVEWKPLTGIFPPFTHQVWLKEFELYKNFPEFQVLNSQMALNEFKFIYFMEYTHRLLARLIGVWFFVPLVYFWKSLKTHDKKDALLILLLGGSQGVIGWYMVKSGLVKDPQVSPYRLCLHLLTAFLLLYFVLNLYLKDKFLEKIPSNLSYYVCLFFLVLTISYGALVAGFKAGLIYNTYPLMGDDFFPSQDALSIAPFWINFFKNHATIQWTHRWLAFITLILCFYISLKDHTAKSRYWLMCLVTIQFLLGIVTLLLSVPVVLGTLHQGVAALVFMALIWFEKEKNQNAI